MRHDDDLIGTAALAGIAFVIALLLVRLLG